MSNPIWASSPSIEGLQHWSVGTIGETIGIRFTEIGDDYLIAEMPVNQHTVQPMRMLHGGASCVLAETLGSIAGFLVLKDISKEYVVGTEINASHLRSVPEGQKVFGKVTPVRIGRRVQVWQIDITDKRGKLICVCRLSCQVVRS
ncbi:MAG: hotdog fold thioesterase [Bacteroidota bacterium]